MDVRYPWSGQDKCFDILGRNVPCPGSGQDAEYHPGRIWPTPRFELLAEALVHDRLTGLFWPQNANLAGWPMSHSDALAFVRRCNHDVLLGRSDWRLPLRREMLSLLSLAHSRPALPPGHPFVDVFQHWYWTESVSAVSHGHVWRVHLEGGRMFSGPRDAEHLVWPVSGESWLLQEKLKEGLRLKPSPQPRFQESGQEIYDCLSGLVWLKYAFPEKGDTSWGEALEATRNMGVPWRLPSIWELESLVDISRAWPALPQGHPFMGIGPDHGRVSTQYPDQTEDIGLWSSTSSGYDQAWAWVLYVGKGAVGVGHKLGRHFKFLLTRGQE
ncbi:MAG: DUF1566 domain-containing protein [Desulfovibrio sp.]|nr:DUF1566 domain-containing protein [Desulfovibrio sp.]MBI4960195.1 DUF1566 domain-containing protein [Desulfovibrio sp.]